MKYKGLSTGIAFGIAFMLVNLAGARCIDVFYNPTCPHCQEELNFLYGISKTYNLTINEFDVLNQNVLPLFENLSREYNSSGDVPLAFVGNYAFVGFAYGNSTEYVNPRLQLGFSSAIISAIQKSGSECPNILSLNSFVCSSATCSVVTPQQAEAKASANYLLDIAYGVGFVIAIVAAVVLARSIVRRRSHAS